MRNVVDEIKDKLAIEDLVSQYVQLKKVGRSLKGLCPFHTEKTPSFIVSPDRQIAYCFGCNKGGDIFRFIQEIEGVDFPSALKILAERAGVQVDESRSHEPRISGDERDQLIQMYDKATEFYEEQLWETDKGAKVLEYLRKRGLTDDSIRLWRVGFSPDSYEETYTHLLKKGFNRKILVSGGMALTRETTVDKIYDRFRGRLMFPIFDSLGRVVAFGGRALSKEQEPKYLNSPESPIYHKSQVLYGYFQSKQSIKHLEEAVIVEGYMDAMMSYQEGVTNVVAPCGTALAGRQLRILKPFIRSIVLAFDTDLAGQEASKRAYDLAQEFDFLVKTVEIPEGKDPAEYALTHKGLLPQVISQSIPYSEYYYSRLLKAYGTDTMSAKKTIIREFAVFFRELKSAVEKDEFVRKLAHDLNLKEVQVYDEIKNLTLPSSHPARLHGGIEGDEEETKIVKRTAEELILGLMIEFPRIGKLNIQKMEEALFSESLKPIYNTIVAHYNGQGLDSVKDFMAALSPDMRERAALLSLYTAEKYGEMSEEAVEKELAVLTAHVRKGHLDERKRGLQKELSEAEKEGDKDRSHDILSRIAHIHKEFTL